MDILQLIADLDRLALDHYKKASRANKAGRLEEGTREYYTALGIDRALSHIRQNWNTKIAAYQCRQTTGRDDAAQ